MIKIAIPGRDDLNLTHLLLDYNGTIALDGEIINGVASRLRELAAALEIIIITADTHGTAAQACTGLPVKLFTRPTANVAQYKAEVAYGIHESDKINKIVSIGNGFNDVQMLKASDLAIAVVGTEGAYGQLLASADIIVMSILDALDLLLKPLRTRATLRS